MQQGNTESRAKFIAAILVGALALGAAWYFLFPPMSSGPRDSPIALRIGVQDNAFPALVYIAAQQGVFALHGLDVTLKKYASGKEALMALFRNEVDLATVGTFPLAERALKHKDFKIVCSVAYSDQPGVLLARRDHGILSPRDLVGKKIATQEGSALEYFLYVFLLSQGISEANVQVVFLQPEQFVDHFVKGAIDAFTAREPYEQTALNALNSQVAQFSSEDSYREMFNIVLPDANTFQGQREKVLDRLMRSLVEAETLTNASPDEAKKAVLTELGPSRQADVNQAWANDTFRVSLEQALLTILESQGLWILERQGKSRASLPNYRDLVDVTPLKGVRPVSVDIR